ncbi:MAG: DsrE family protein [Hyphomicrobiaceae bacterium]
MTRNVALSMVALAAFAALILPAAIRAGEPSSASFSYAPQKVVFHNNGRGDDSAKYFKGLLRNITNNIEAVGRGRIDIKVVDHSDGIKLFQLANTDAELAKTLDELRAKGVQFLICRNTLKERNIDWHTLYGVKEADLVPSGIAHLVYLQQQGYAYLHP